MRRGAVAALATALGITLGPAGPGAARLDAQGPPSSASASDGVSDVPRLVAAREADATPLLAAPVRPSVAGGWVPLLDADWAGGRARAEAWLRAAWSARGVRVTVALPHVDPAARVPAGEFASGPFAVHLGFESARGPYELRCGPVADPVTRMMTRSQPALFNARLGANARVGETGHVMCAELTLRHVLPDSVQTRWGPLPGGGAAFEAFVPWATLGLRAPAPGGELPLRVVVAPHGRARRFWGDSARMGRVRLAASAEAVPAPVYPLLAAAAVAQPAAVAVAVPAAGPGKSLAAALVDAQGRVRARAGGQSQGDAAVLRLTTAGLPDGIYRVRVTAPAGSDAERAATGRTVADRTVADRTVADRTVRLAGSAVTQLAAARERAERRLAALGAAANGAPAWTAGHLARARAMLALAAAGDASDTSRARARRLVADAERVIAAVSAGRRPPAAAEGFEHPAGFAADGRRGPVTFVPVTTDANPAAALPRATVTVHTGRPTTWRIGPRFYGTFSEPVVYDRPIYGWLDAQALRNPGFLWGHPSAEHTARDFVRARELDSAAAGAALGGRWIARRRAASTDSVAAPWMAVGPGADAARYAIACDTAARRACQRITATAGEAGVAQLVSLPAWRATRYRLHTVARGDGTVRRARVRLYHAGRAVDSADVPLDTAWRAADAELVAPAVPGPVNAYVLAVTIDGSGTAELRKVTLRPADADGIFDPQAVAQLRDLRTGWVRWPGGNYASAYRWRDGIGPADARPSTPNPSWPGLNDNAVGTDEFLQLAERAGFETLVTVNAGDGTPEEAAAWVEYVNGDSTTPMGRLRARNGHAVPYNVRHWNVGNELWGHWQVGYTDPEGNAERYARFARAMRAADSTIVVVANAHGGHSESPPRPWNDALLERNGRALEWLDLHTYVGVPNDSGLTPAHRAFLLSAIPLSYEQWIAEFAGDVQGRGLGALRAIVGEYNGEVRTGDSTVDRAAALVTSAAYLHAFVRQGDFVVGANATEYSPFDPRARAFGRMHPRFDLFRTWAAHAGTQPLAATVETPVAQQPRRVGRDVLPIFNVPLVDAVALRDTSTGATTVSLVNRDMTRPVAVTVRLEGTGAGRTARWFLLRGTPGTGVDERTVAVPNGDALTVTLPPHSASLLSVSPAGARQEGTR